jgi:uncharacterized iron-regulated membrane protein
VKELEEKLKEPRWEPETPVQQQEQPAQSELEVTEEAPPQEEIVLMEPGMEPDSPTTEHPEPKKKRKFF